MKRKNMGGSSEPTDSAIRKWRKFDMLFNPDFEDGDEDGDEDDTFENTSEDCTSDNLENFESFEDSDY